MANKKKRKKSAEPVALLRMAVGTIFIIHGIARTYLGIVDDFGEFLLANAIPFGDILAWVLTTVEIIGGLAFVFNRAVLLLAPWYIAELTAGIALVHWKEGWFVVGAGRNGMEFSALLIFCLIVIFHSALKRRGILS